MSDVIHAQGGEALTAISRGHLLIAEILIHGFRMVTRAVLSTTEPSFGTLFREDIESCDANWDALNRLEGRIKDERGG